jgi:glycosyltransferase involved in cell wall biosynthesis
MNRRLRVAHLIGSTGVYGAERWILALVRHLPADAVESVVVNLVDGGDDVSAMTREATAHGVAAVDFRTGGRFNPVGAVRLGRWLRASSIDVLHTHGYKADVLGLLAVCGRRLPLVATPHSWDPAPGTRLRAYETLDLALLRLADRVCPLSPALDETLQRARIPAARIRPILNAVDVGAVDAVPAAARLPGDGPLVGYIGRLASHKGVGCLVEAFGRLARVHREARLLVVGEGPLRPDLEAQASELAPGRVVFTGYRDDALGLLKALDVLVLPSAHEGIPRCVMEAMAAGVPVVASDIPGTRLLVEDRETGLLVPPGDVGRLAGALDALLDDPHLGRALAKRARARVEADFSATRMAAEYLALYRELVR